MSQPPSVSAAGEHGRDALRSAKLSLVVGSLVLVLKWIAWRLTGSVALFSDAVESVVNVVAAGAAVIALRIAAKPPDHDHPWGHGKAEYFSAVIEGILIVVAAGTIAVEAWQRFFHAAPLDAVGPGIAVSALASGANGWLAWHLVRRGRALRSPALTADGKHLWADVVTSVGVWIGVTLASVTEWWVLDPLLALLVAANVVRAGWAVVRDSVGGLMDEALPPEDVARVHDVVRAHLGETAIEVHDLKTRRSAERTFIEFHLVVPGSMTVRASHALCDRLENALSEAVPGSLTQIHVEPEREAQGAGRVSGL